MAENEEMAYIQGDRAAWSKILSDGLVQLGYDNPAVTQKHRWILEREAIIAQLRDLRGEFGDNNWNEKLHLSDVIEKHLGKHLYALQKKAISIIKSAKKYVKQAHDSAECLHDTYGEYYMDGVQYEIMQETEALLTEMEAIIDKFENT